MGIVSRSQGGSGGGAVLFDSTLGADAASIDTGAGGIAQSQNVLEIWVIARTDQAAVGSAALLTFNNDSGAVYDYEQLTGTNVTAAAAPGNAQTSILLDAKGASAAANEASIVCLLLPGYTQTTFFKAGTSIAGAADTTAAGSIARVTSFQYRSTTAVSRAKIANGGGTVLKAGSRLLILGR